MDSTPHHHWVTFYPKWTGILLPMGGGLAGGSFPGIFHHVEWVRWSSAATTILGLIMFAAAVIARARFRRKVHDIDPRVKVL